MIVQPFVIFHSVMGQTTPTSCFVESVTTFNSVVTLLNHCGSFQFLRRRNTGLVSGCPLRRISLKSDTYSYRCSYECDVTSTVTFNSLRVVIPILSHLSMVLYINFINRLNGNCSTKFYKCKSFVLYLTSLLTVQRLTRKIAQWFQCLKVSVFSSRHITNTDIRTHVFYICGPALLCEVRVPLRWKTSPVPPHRSLLVSPSTRILLVS